MQGSFCVCAHPMRDDVTMYIGWAHTPNDPCIRFHKSWQYKHCKTKCIFHRTYCTCSWDILERWREKHLDLTRVRPHGIGQFSTKPLPESRLSYSQMALKNKIRWNLDQNTKLSFKKMYLNMLSPKCWPFLQNISQHINLLLTDVLQCRLKMSDTLNLSEI